MHSKLKGNIGEASVILALTKLGYNIFKELGDYSKIDLIAEKDTKLLRIQCKGLTPFDGKIQVPLTKSGPNYKYTYKESDFDYLGICDLDSGKVAFLSSKILKEDRKTISLRVAPTKNNQRLKVWYFDDFSNIEDSSEAIRRGDDQSQEMVQTTTNRNVRHRKLCVVG